MKVNWREMRGLMNSRDGLLESWIVVWLGCAVSAPIIGLATLWIGGAWNVLRARMTSEANADRDYCRRVAILTSLISALPILLIFLGNTVRFRTPNDYFASDAIILTSLIFGMWSSYATHSAMTREYSLRSGAAIFWFLVVPLSAYVILLVRAAVYLGLLLS
jgi:hypothetical protein